MKLVSIDKIIESFELSNAEKIELAQLLLSDIYWEINDDNNDVSKAYKLLGGK